MLTKRWNPPHGRAMMNGVNHPMLKLALPLCLTMAAVLGAEPNRPRTTTTAASTAPAVAADELAPATCGKIARVHRLADVFLAGQPSADDLAQAKKDGIKTVINLRPNPENKAFDERKAAEAAGLKYVHIPFTGADDVTDAVFDEARKQLKVAERPILLHCGSANRVGAVWLPHRVLDAGLTWDAALAEAKTIGLRSSALEAKAREYVARHRQ